MREEPNEQAKPEQPTSEEVLLQRERLQHERDLHAEDLRLREAELQAQSKQQRLGNPIIVAVVVGLIGYLGNQLGSYSQHRATLVLEREKQEGALIVSSQ